MFCDKILPCFASSDTPSVLCKIRPPNTMFYGVLKIAQNQLILCTPMKLAKWKDAIELPGRTFCIILDFRRETKGNACANLQCAIWVDKIKEIEPKPNKFHLVQWFESTKWRKSSWNLTVWLFSAVAKLFQWKYNNNNKNINYFIVFNCHMAFRSQKSLHRNMLSQH